MSNQLTPMQEMIEFLENGTYYDIENILDKAIELLPKEQQVIDKKNNGWIKIESEEDLPKENGEYWTIRKNGIMIKEHFYLSNPLNWIKYYNVTHYQPIVKPLPPIY